LLLDQDRSQWDPVHIMRGLCALDQAQARASDLGPYSLQAAIAACHVRAEATDCVQIAGLYELLAQRTGSPVVEVNRAVALGMAYGPEAGLEPLDQLSGAAALQGYHLLPSVRGGRLEKLGRHEEAVAEFARAATLTHNETERALLLDRARGRSWSGRAAP
jgi:RNA polymerase sigma-70 factor (ECF subfamily)